MLNALPEAERKQAILNFSKTGNNNPTEAFKDNVVIMRDCARTICQVPEDNASAI